MSQARGWSEMPPPRQAGNARVNASWAHSSARSQSPVHLIRAATTRPQSDRKTSAILRSTSPAPTPAVMTR
jgi:hypothetical protein